MPLSFETITSIYDFRAPCYDTKEDNHHPALAADYIHIAKKYFPPPKLQHEQRKPLIMLDLCCGTGLVTFSAIEILTDYNLQITGVDLSPASLDIANRKLATYRSTKANDKGERKVDVTFSRGNVLQLDGILPEEQRREGFDLITCCSAYVLLPTETAEERKSILAMWKELLSPSGILVVDVPAPNANLTTFCVSDILARYGVDEVSRRWITGDAAWVEVFESAGLEVFECITSKSYGFQPYQRDNVGDVWDRSVGSNFFEEAGRKLTDKQKRDGREKFVDLMMSFSKDGKVLEDHVKLIIGVARRK